MSRLTLFKYRLPLMAPIRLGRHQVEYREGLLLHRHESDREQWGDAAPLPGFSTETLDQVISAARQERWHAWPSLAFAFASLQIERRAESVPVNALIWNDGEPLDDQVVRIKQIESQRIKLKVARHESWQREAEIIDSLRQALRSDQSLCLDANRQWTYEQAYLFAKRLGPERIAYIEEPTRSPSDFERLTNETGLPYALDETLRELGRRDQFPNAAAYVIKPTLMGDCRRLGSWVRPGVPIVLSAAFESGIGLLNIARLATHISPGLPVGLDTYRWLADDVVSPRWKWSNGQFYFDDSWNVEYDDLEELKL